MDLSMPGTNGVEATRRITRADRRVGVLALTMLEAEDSVFAAMRTGARGYVLKGATGEETLQAIRTVASGGAIFSPAVARQVLGYFASPRRSGGTRAAEAFPDLTDRERDVLGLLAAGYTHTATAERLCLCPKTVRNDASHIFGKLQVADRAQAIIRAREAGLG